MFTGIVTDQGVVRHVRKDDANHDMRARIGCAYRMDEVDLGASIACDGVCLTVVDKGEDWFEVDVSAETCAVTTIGARGWTEGQTLNLERALRVGDELGGHIVSGHVDGLAKITAMQSEGGSTRFTFEAPAELARFIAAKGSVALDGTSLTVNDVSGRSFGVNIIPHTREVTSWGRRQVGDLVNLEIDTLARYVARLAEAQAGETGAP